jgi:hypothetical protein
MSSSTRARVIAANKARAIPADAQCRECPDRVYAKDLCRKHYSRNRRTAIPRGLPFIVYPWEWNDPRIRSILQAQADKSGNIRVGARKCVITEVSVIEARQFLDAHHLQGYVHAPVRYGLRHEDRLLALMTFGTPRDQKRNDPIEWELIRFCVRKGYLVTGGASRLFRHFIIRHRPRSIVSYSDIAKTTGEMYPRLGFSLANQSAPGYVWWNGTDVRSRQSCMVHKLRAAHPELPVGMTETQIMTMRGYAKVPNRGNKVWVWRSM